jgi:hypothetical protein
LSHQAGPIFCHPVQEGTQLLNVDTRQILINPQAFAKVHVNIYNFLDHRRNPERFSLILFPSVKKLRDYSVPSYIYPLKLAKKDTFLKGLLRPFFFNRNMTI